MTEQLLLGNQNPVQLYSLQFLTIICITAYHAIISVQCLSFPLPSSLRLNGSVACAFAVSFIATKVKKSTSFSKWVSKFLASFLMGLQVVLGMFPFPVWRFFLKLLLFLWAPGQDPAYPN